MKEAVEEVETVNKGWKDLSVAVDGTWQKRGYTSQNGVITATSVDTGKVIDVEILSKHCRCINKFIGQNSEKCCANYQGVWIYTMWIYTLNTWVMAIPKGLQVF